MRRRLLLSAILTSVGAVLVLGLPLAFAGTSLIHNDARQSLEHDADNIAATVEDNFEQGRTLTASTLARVTPKDLHVVVLGRDGILVSSGRRISGRLLEARSHAAKDAVVFVQGSAAEMDARIQRLWLLVAGLAAGGVVTGVALALLHARRLGAPLDALASSSRRLGGGDFSARASKHGIPEIDAVADALNASAAQIAELVATERRFAISVSHQLRTPLTGIRMRLEELTECNDVAHARSEAHAALHQVDRLTGTINELLQLTRTGRLGEKSLIDLPSLVRSHVESWRDVCRSKGVALSFRSDPATAKVQATAGVVGQALDVLLDNSIKHGSGTVNVSIERQNGRMLIHVSDEGQGVPEGLEDDIFEWSTSAGTSTREGLGIGLALAKTLVESDGGRLTLTRSRPAEFEISLPAEDLG